MRPEFLADVLGAVSSGNRGENVLVGPEGFDDAAVVRSPSGELIVQSADFFTPIVDDPYAFGQIAAANALSDLYAMGATPLFALNIVAFPTAVLGPDVLARILQGGADKAAEAGISIVGGHSVEDEEPKYGLVVTGTISDGVIWRNSGAQSGDQLILTKALGSGIYTTALKRQELDEAGIAEVTQVMSQLNKDAAEVGQLFEVHGATDITGFGLLGHLAELANASDATLEISWSAMPVLTNAEALAENGTVPGGSRKNLAFVQPSTHFADSITDAQRLVLADAQTSGGLVLAVAPGDTEEMVTALAERGVLNRVIGSVHERTDVAIRVKE